MYSNITTIWDIYEWRGLRSSGPNWLGGRIWTRQVGSWKTRLSLYNIHSKATLASSLILSLFSFSSLNSNGMTWNKQKLWNMSKLTWNKKYLTLFRFGWWDWMDAFVVQSYQWTYADFFEFQGVIVSYQQFGILHFVDNFAQIHLLRELPNWFFYRNG